MQLSMLLSSMEFPDAGIYLIQYIGELNEALEVATFRWAWERATQRHAVLRTAFFWRGRVEPLQEVVEQVTVPWQIEDWRGLSPEERQNRLEVYLQADRRGGAEFPDTPDPLPASHGENLAYVLYTSGTIGNPKGVLVEHRQLTGYVQAVVDQYGMAHSCAFAMLQPLTVDSCQTMIFPALGRGGTLHLISSERTLNPSALRDYFQNIPSTF